MISTEAADPRSEQLDAWPVSTILEALLESQMRAAAAVQPALGVLERVIEAAIPRLAAGGRIAYAGAGTSGRIAWQDGAELTPTFDWPPERLVFLMAGGSEALLRAVEGAEDRAQDATDAVAAQRLGPADVLLAVAASGATPYTRAAVQAARASGCLTVGIANQPAAPLLTDAEIGVLVATGAEMVRGSTRLKAGTAQKIVLNMISTTLMIGLGRVYRGQMVDMIASNSKLRRRARRMLLELTGCAAPEIEHALAESGGKVKLALLILRGMDRPAAERLLAAHGNNLRRLLDETAPVL